MRSIGEENWKKASLEKYYFAHLRIESLNSEPKVFTTTTQVLSPFSLPLPFSFL
jgi:hypothetical protein